MGVVIAILTVAVALAKTGVVRRVRNVLPAMNRIAGGLMLVAGAYVAYYGWYEIRVLNGATDDPIVDAAVELQTWLQNRIVPDDPIAFVTAAVVVLVVVALGATVLRRRRTRRTGLGQVAKTAPAEPGAATSASPRSSEAVAPRG
jgi:hypothetical protein